MLNFRSPILNIMALISFGIFMPILMLRPLVKNPVPKNVEEISCPVCPEKACPSCPERSCPACPKKICSSCPENKLSETAPKGIVVPMEQIVSGTPVILPQDDKNLIDYILAKKYIEPPSGKSYNLTQPNVDPSRGQSLFIRNLLNNITNGFFVECGALDGETRSNTLFLEMHLNWKGLLIEGDPKNFALLQNKNRKAWASNNCLSVNPYPHKASFLQRFNTGKILKTEETTKFSKQAYVEVQCMPLFSLLAAINVTTVDYFSLDVEGSELKVLKTIPFDKVFIRTLSVEYIHTAEGKNELIKFMTSKGYRVVGEVHYKGWLANDIMFAHKYVKLPEKQKSVL